MNGINMIITICLTVLSTTICSFIIYYCPIPHSILLLTSTQSAVADLPARTGTAAAAAAPTVIDCRKSNEGIFEFSIN